MKYILILVLLVFSLCDDEKPSLGAWKKRSINENDFEIEQSFRKAFRDYSESNDVEFDDLIRLTVYSQVVNGNNYKVTFIDPNSEYPTIQEYVINKGISNKNEEGYKIQQHNKYENTEGVISFNDPSFTLLENKLYTYLKDTKEELDFISLVYPLKNDNTNFYMINAYTKEGEHQYIVCQDNSSNEFDFFGKVK